MNERILEENVKIRYSEMDYDLVLKPSVLLNFLQDLASESAENLGFGYSYIVKKNLAWFLLKYHMEFSDYPSGLYNITIKTEPRGCNKLFAYRDFWIYDGEREIGKIVSTWGLVDINSRSMVNVQEALCNNPQMPIYEKRENDLAYNKVRPPQNITLEKEFEIRFDDIDVNKHVNNANYIVWAFESLDYEFKSKHKLKTLDMVYKKEIKYGEKILSQVEINDNITSHAVKNAQTGEDLCLITAEWQEK